MRKKCFVLGVCLLSLILFAGTVYADRTGLYWPGGTKPTVEYDPTNGGVLITWPDPINANLVVGYRVTMAIKQVTNYSDLGPDVNQLYFLPQLPGETWTISVAAKDAEGNVAVIKTRFTIP